MSKSKQHSNGVREVPLSELRVDGGTQMRANGSPQDAIDDYADKLAAGLSFPPVVAFDDGTSIWLADGFTRLAAYLKAARDTIPVDVRAGSLRDAILYAVGANEDHGVKRTDDDKKKAVLTLLQDPEWVGRTDRWIADTAKVSPTTVAKYRLRSTVHVDSAPQTRTTSDGRRHPAHPKPGTPKPATAAASPPPPAAPPSPTALPPEPEPRVPGNDGANAFDTRPPAPATTPIADQPSGVEDDSLCEAEAHVEKELPSTDEAGETIPEHLRASYALRDDFKAACKQLDVLHADAERLGKSPAGAFSNWQSIQSHIRNAEKAFKAATPTHVCPYCHGAKPKCQACHGGGLVPRRVWNSKPKD